MCIGHNYHNIEHMTQITGYRLYEFLNIAGALNEPFKYIPQAGLEPGTYGPTWIGDSGLDHSATTAGFEKQKLYFVFVGIKMTQLTK